MAKASSETLDNADSPISVLEEKERSASEAADGNDTSGNEGVDIPEDMIAEERRLEEERTQRERLQAENKKDVQHMDDVKFSKLEELLNQTQLYSEFLLERMDDITQMSGDKANAESQEGSKGRRGRKRKAATTSNGSNKKVKAAINAMISSKEDVQLESSDNLTEEERLSKEQSELVPLLTGGKLKSYQIKGVKWLISLWQNGLNGILADQMGLGKTVQTIGFLAHLKGMGLNGPFLIVAPLSTLSNWVNEIQRFVPTMKTLLYHGSQIERRELQKKYMPRTVGPDFPVIVTSYEIAMNDVKMLSAYHWKYLVVDEGHRLKNFNCRLVKELRTLIVENKLLLTGTPLQNNLAELWSLLNFILPSVFASREEFESWFDLSGRQVSDMNQEEIIEKRRAQVISKLHLILRPFLLRRVKENVEISLPRKKEILLYATMTDHQEQIQEHLINKTIGNYAQQITGRIAKSKFNNLMIQLRKNCNHPDLLESQFEESYLYPPVEIMVQQCGKLALLDRLIKHLKARKHKILIFSQWTKVLDILDYYFSEMGYETCRIDGSVKLEDRRRQIADFNDENSDTGIFLLSTRAGGLGINLTAADTVIIYDSDWNPQMDLQAMDRCHRIGQTKPVHVYRLVTAASVEGRMLKVAYGKLKLEHLVIEKGQFRQERIANDLQESDLIALLKPERDEEEKTFECDISEENLLRLLDRSDMLDYGIEETGAKPDPLPLKGPGWEVIARSGQSLLSSI